MNYEKNLCLEISDSELESLECPTFDEQEFEWKKIFDSILNENLLKSYLATLNFELKNLNHFSETGGVINKIFILTVNERMSHNIEKKLLLRANNPHKFWKKRRCSNEVGIMKYLRANTSIPVPEIIDFSNDSDKSPLKCEFILMEFVYGQTLSDFINSNPNNNQLDDRIIDQIISYVNELKSINVKEDKIGCFDERMNISSVVQDGPTVNSSENYFDYLNEQIDWTIREMRKFKKYQSLADSYKTFKDRLNHVVRNNSHLDNLNFNDQKCVFHGDLNASNILIDPKEMNITAILDWEFCMFGFDNVELDFFKYWYDSAEEKESFFERITQKDLSKMNKQKGLYFRKYLFNLVQTGNQFGFYVSSWHHKSKNPYLDIRKAIEKEATCFKELLDQSEQYLILLAEYTTKSVIYKTV